MMKSTILRNVQIDLFSGSGGSKASEFHYEEWGPGVV